ncbi:MAG: CotH kinase family protein [Bacteroidia bacterium]|nr:CotH kinase family protein [Bacteroidia bacterium]
MKMILKLKISRVFFLILLFISFSLQSKSQNDFYDNNNVREIRLYFSQSDWDHKLDSLFVEGLEGRLLASVTIDGVALDSVGVRYKGYSSVDTATVKNPLNIELDYIIPSQEYRGVTKLKLSNVIHDPSFVREVLSYEIARKYMPASKANYANVYINDTLMGLYNNVEAVNKNFAETHFGTRYNSFFKGNPAVLNYPTGANSNLQYYNTDSTSYYPFYSLESDFGWTDLYRFINILNNQTDSIENVLNVDRALWMLALDYALVNLDSYIAYSQNYYLYQDKNKRFNTVLWDMNMSFGSFRLSDGGTSAMTGGLTITQAKNLNPCGLLTYSVSQRPLIKKLLQNNMWKKMYLAHIRTIVNENFVTGNYYSRAQQLQQLVSNSVQNDFNKFYSYSDFINNIDTTVGGTGGMIQYPGIKDFIQGRTTYLSNYSGFQGAPTISNIIDSVLFGNKIWITAKINFPDSCFLAYRYGIYEIFNKVKMYDDGAHNDGIAGDSVYGAAINDSILIQYYIYAQNSTSGVFSPERAEYEFYTIQKVSASNVVINEFMADNVDYITDNYSEYEDWIELYNNSTNDFNMSGLYLSDDRSNFMKWPFPDTTIGAHSYLVIWADNDAIQTGLHTNFKLSKTGEALFLSYSPTNILDSITFGLQTSDISTGRYPNGTGSFGKMLPTMSSTNSPFSVSEIKFSSEISVYPNPSSSWIEVNIVNSNSNKLRMELISITGKILFQEEIQKDYSENIFKKYDISRFQKGMYFLKISSEKDVIIKKIIFN